jgi:hypothetical protein
VVLILASLLRISSQRHAVLRCTQRVQAHRSRRIQL